MENTDEAADDDAGAASKRLSDDDEPSPTDVAQPAETTAQASSLAEDVMAGPSPFPPGDPVRLETAACPRRCMLDGTTSPAWVLQMVMPGSTRPVDGPTAAQFGEVRGASTLPKQNLNVAFQGAANT